MGLLQTMQLLSTATLLLGLIFSIIVILFIVISILLIYSLLMISIETKAYENGVLRLVGLSKANCIQMIIVQSLLFVLPSIIFAYAASFPALIEVYKYLFKNQPGVHVSPFPTFFATLLALGLGLLIPLFSSIVPIQKALSKNLAESLNARVSKTKGSKVSIQEKGERNVLSYLIFGFISVLTGIAIFYLLPLAVLNFDIALILQIFFLILLGMILGLTLISFNLQRLLELAIVNFVLFFERASMKMMIKKNLIAHRESNKLTSIIYSLTLACIIFVVVAANL
jgi:hypothetical protein